MYPYYYNKPNGLFSNISNLTKGVTFSGFLDGCQKTLNVINQAIPIVYQVKPIINNAKTMFKIANVINSPDVSNDDSNEINNNKNNNDNNYQENLPLFYI